MSGGDAVRSYRRELDLDSAVARTEFQSGNSRLAREVFAAAAPRMAVPLGWKNTELGVFEMMMPLVYGLAVVLGFIGVKLYNDYLSDTVYLRYATASPAIDPETGNVYAQGTQGILATFTPAPIVEER